MDDTLDILIVVQASDSPIVKDGETRNLRADRCVKISHRYSKDGEELDPGKICHLSVKRVLPIRGQVFPYLWQQNIYLLDQHNKGFRKQCRAQAM